ncbi:MAG TPA: bifunctional 2-keto-4-hydroxyglutarate aldolase/2-keto-3-deoxy-6-phosphogluconate aldolase [Clostridiales bacterium]|nr:bifunctional 2-keto-4-hydroxyglutarate aldolase/2-keto-3-deoxy-6-phosphogluconate aldolase [Clostridiales bacterium]
MNRQEVVGRIKKSGLVAVVRADSEHKAVAIAEQCAEAGVAAIEITFTVPGAHRIIEKLAGHFGSTILVGAGTVLDAETARIAILSGARYVVSPCLVPDVVRCCSRYQVAVMPGAMTIRETLECMEAGADMVKVFPGELFGPAVIKAIKGPLPQAPLMPTGGVSLDNVAQWIKAGAEAVGVGGALTASVAEKGMESIRETAEKFIAEIQKARGTNHG